MGTASDHFDTIRYLFTDAVIGNRPILSIVILSEMYHFNFSLLLAYVPVLKVYKSYLLIHSSTSCPIKMNSGKAVLSKKKYIMTHKKNKYNTTKKIKLLKERKRGIGKKHRKRV